MQSNLYCENVSHVTSSLSAPVEMGLTQETPVAVRPYLYALVKADQSQLKIGRSTNPLERISYLKGIYPEIDLSESLLIAVDDPRIEKVLHTIFEARGVTLPEKKEGYTEWFDGDIRDDLIVVCQLIARHRRCKYPVLRGLDSVIEDYQQRANNFRKRQQVLNAAGREKKRRQEQREMCRQAVEKTQTFLDILDEHPIDGVHQDGECFQLVRTVSSAEEPECWSAKSPLWASAWSNRLHSAGKVKVSAGESFGFFLIVLTASFEALDDDFGQETIELTQSPQSGARSGHRIVLPRRLAFRAIRKTLAGLPVIDRNSRDLTQKGGER